jgi:hypothetical protein
MASMGKNNFLEGNFTGIQTNIAQLGRAAVSYAGTARWFYKIRSWTYPLALKAESNSAM